VAAPGRARSPMGESTADGMSEPGTRMINLPPMCPHMAVDSRTGPDPAGPDKIGPGPGFPWSRAEQRTGRTTYLWRVVDSNHCSFRDGFTVRHEGRASPAAAGRQRDVGQWTFGSFPQPSVEHVYNAVDIEPQSVGVLWMTRHNLWETTWLAFGGRVGYAAR